MTEWETKLTTRDTNRIVRPLEWGFDWLTEFSATHSNGQLDVMASHTPADCCGGDSSDQFDAQDLIRMIALNREIVDHAEEFFGYETPQDFRLEERHPELFPTNVRPETLAQEAEMKRQAAAGELDKAEFLRFTSPVRTPYPENDQVNARWYPAPQRKGSPAGAPKQAIIILPQWNSDAISHNALCTLFNRFGTCASRSRTTTFAVRQS